MKGHASSDGLVIAHHGGQVRVRLADGNVVAVAAPRKRGLCVAGDHVRVVGEAGDLRLLDVLERRNLLARPAYRGRDRALAANVDRIVAVVAPRPTLDPDLLDRCLVVAAHCRIEAIIVCNKRDMLGDDGAERRLMADYAAAGYPVFFTDARDGAGVGELAVALQGLGSVLVGASGVGKSRLTRTLTGDDSARSGELGAASHGRHTTSSAILYELPGGGFLVDSPGVRDFGIWRLRADELAHGFREFIALQGKCRFRDCRHVAEPDCALAQACANGHISERRLHSYRRMLAAAEDAG